MKWSKSWPASGEEEDEQGSNAEGSRAASDSEDSEAGSPGDVAGPEQQRRLRGLMIPCLPFDTCFDRPGLLRLLSIYNGVKTEDVGQSQSLHR